MEDSSNTLEQSKDGTVDEEDGDVIQVGNFLIDMGRILGKGEFGQVYLAQEIPKDMDISNRLEN